MMIYNKFQTSFVDIPKPGSKEAKKMVAHIDIMGHRSDDSINTEVICRVYRRRRGKKEKPLYKLKWFDLAYRKDTLCEAAIDKARQELAHHCDREVMGLFSRAYKQYQAYWIARHPYSAIKISDTMQHRLNAGYRSMTRIVDEITVNGFGDPNIWKSKITFYETWWSSKKKMKKLLTLDDLRLWHRFHRERFRYDM